MELVKTSQDGQSIGGGTGKPELGSGRAEDPHMPPNPGPQDAHRPRAGLGVPAGATGARQTVRVRGSRHSPTPAGCGTCSEQPRVALSASGLRGTAGGSARLRRSAAGRSPAQAAPPAVARDAVRDSCCLSVRQPRSARLSDGVRMGERAEPGGAQGAAAAGAGSAAGAGGRLGAARPSRTEGFLPCPVLSCSALPCSAQPGRGGRSVRSERGPARGLLPRWVRWDTGQHGAGSLSAISLIMGVWFSIC